MKRIVSLLLALTMVLLSLTGCVRVPGQKDAQATAAPAATAAPVAEATAAPSLEAATDIYSKLSEKISSESERSGVRCVIEKINESSAYIVSADINSGLNGDTGLGDLYVISDLTVSIGTYKYGHFLGRAKTAMKNKVNCDIGIKIIGETKELN